MLVLTRRKDESIVIDGGRIKVKVVDIRNGKVLLGITAPRAITVYREEVQEHIDRLNRKDLPLNDPSM